MIQVSVSKPIQMSSEATENEDTSLGVQRGLKDCLVRDIFKLYEQKCDLLASLDPLLYSQNLQQRIKVQNQKIKNVLIRLREVSSMNRSIVQDNENLVEENQKLKEQNQQLQRELDFQVDKARSTILERDQELARLAQELDTYKDRANSMSGAPVAKVMTKRTLNPLPDSVSKKPRRGLRECVNPVCTKHLGYAKKVCDSCFTVQSGDDKGKIQTVKNSGTSPGQQ